MIYPVPAERSAGTKYKKEYWKDFQDKNRGKNYSRNYNKVLQQRIITIYYNKKNGRPHLPRPSVFSLLLFVLFVFFRFLSFAVFSGGIQLALIIALDHFQVLDKDGAGFGILTDTDTLVAVDNDLYLIHVVQTGQ